jgi:hypothetical protein
MHPLKNIHLVLLISCLLGFISCSKNSAHPETVEESDTRIQLIHASPGTAGIKLWQDNTFFQAVGYYYKSNSYYFPLASGPCELAIRHSKTDALLTSVSANLQQGARYSLFVCDSPSRITPVLVMDSPLPVRSDKAQIRLVNILSSGESLNLLLNNENKISALAYKNASNYQYIDPGVISCQILNSSNANALTPSFVYAFDAGKTYTIYVNGFSFLTGAAGTDAIIVVNI